MREVERSEQGREHEISTDSTKHRGAADDDNPVVGNGMSLKSFPLENGFSIYCETHLLRPAHPPPPPPPEA